MVMAGKFRGPSFLDTSSFRIVTPKNLVPKYSTGIQISEVGCLCLPPGQAEVGWLLQKCKLMPTSCG